VPNLRIACGGLATESCTFSPLPTTLADFAVREGEALRQGYPFLETLPGQWLPLLHARALPGGTVTQAAYRTLKHEFLARLRAQLPVAGIYLDLHGAMHVDGMLDAEADFVAAIRHLVGPQPLIGVSLDLHANVSPAFSRLVDLAVAFRTAPHIDAAATRERTCRLLAQCLVAGRRPYLAHRRIPVILPGEKTSTEWEPGASLYASLTGTDGEPGVLASSLLVGYAWADEPRTAAAALVTADHREAAESAVSRVARRYWQQRRAFDFGVPAGSLRWCLDRALAGPPRTVFISDSGDNPTAGGAGDVPACLELLPHLGTVKALYASLADAAAVARCRQAGVGRRVELELGGKLDPRHGVPLPCRGRVRGLYDGDPRAGTQAVIGIGSATVIVTDGRKPFHFVRDFRLLDLHPLDFRIVVIKVGYMVPDLKRIAPELLLALTPGAVNQDLTRLPFRRLARPLFPFDPEMDWQPGSLRPRCGTRNAGANGVDGDP
jgi:microcystin degradation protein MlrC